MSSNSPSYYLACQGSAPALHLLHLDGVGDKPVRFSRGIVSRGGYESHRNLASQICSSSQPSSSRPSYGEAPCHHTTLLTFALFLPQASASLPARHAWQRQESVHIAICSKSNKEKEFTITMPSNQPAYYMIRSQM